MEKDSEVHSKCFDKIQIKNVLLQKNYNCL